LIKVSGIRIFIPIIFLGFKLHTTPIAAAEKHFLQFSPTSKYLLLGVGNRDEIKTPEKNDRSVADER
jgi:hypothetical protein